jgi:citrate/tricarballylate utilization protein
LRTTESVVEARRSMEICNACRYCEGFCAVFPAMELRRAFTNGDLSYLANLCHDCRGCYYACQYAPPHEFALNLPMAFSLLRAETHAEYAWPAPFAKLFHRNGTLVALLTSAVIALVLGLAATLQPGELLHQPQRGPGTFYAIVPEAVMLAVAAITFGFALLAMSISFRKFWRDTGGGSIAQARPLMNAVADVLTLRNLGGGGDGCNNKDEAFSQSRRCAHQALFYGFLLCFASTCTAAIYEHLFARIAPYPFFSLPVLLGTAGGIGMMFGTAGLVGVKLASDPAPAAAKVLSGDYALLLLLSLSAASGLLLLGLRSSSAMGILLVLHLGFILALFLLLPYSKFVHAIYRSAALLRNAVERPRA